MIAVEFPLPFFRGLESADKILDQSTADFLAGINRANMSRETLSGLNPDIGTLHRNRFLNPIFDVPDNDVIKPTGGTRECFILLGCPLCPRQFSAQSLFQNHLELHPGVSCMPIIESFGRNDHPSRSWIWDASASHRPPHCYPLSHLNATFFIIWTCTVCSEVCKTYASEVAHLHAGLPFAARFTASLIDYDNEPRQPGAVECRFCSGECGHLRGDGRPYRADMYTHLRKFHHSKLFDPGQWSLQGYFVTHELGFKFLCPELGCGWTFNRYISWVIHNQCWHPGSVTPGKLEVVNQAVSGVGVGV